MEFIIWNKTTIFDQVNRLFFKMSKYESVTEINSITYGISSNHKATGLENHIPDRKFRV